MSDTAEDFNALSEHLRQQRAEKRAARTPLIEQLRAAGYRVHKLTEYQFRVNERLDLYPTRTRWHDVTTGKRGGWGRESAIEVVRRIIG